MQVDRRTMLAGAAALWSRARRWRRRRGAGPAGTTGRSSSTRSAGSAIPMRPRSSCASATAPGPRWSRPASPLLRDTVMPVGNVADPWGDYQKDIALKQNILNANPDRLLLVRSAADILKAKREKKFAVVLGTQDTSMVGPELDRLAQLKKDGVMTVQLTYNNRNLAGDGALEPANAGLSKLGRATIERIEAEKLLLDLSHGGARTMAEAAAHAKRPLVISHTARAGADRPSAQHRRRDDQGGRRQGRGGRRLFHAVPDRSTASPKGEDLHRPCRACREGRRRGPCRHRHRQWRAAA